MTSHPKIVELLKDYMDSDDQSERWITVQEFRTYFHLPKSCSPVIAGIFSGYTRTRRTSVPTG
jgi:hypothetical protein